MQKTLITAIILLAWIQIGSAQVKFGLRGGISTTDIQPQDQTVPLNTIDTLTLTDVNIGYHFGIFLQGQIGKFFLQPEVLFNSNSADFRIRDLGNPDGPSQVLQEKYQYLDIPFMMGFKFGALRLQGGPVGHVFLESNAELETLDGIREKFEQFTYGWQAGLGLDFWNIVLDFKYEGNFSNYGDHIFIGEQRFNFSESPSRFLISLGFAF